MEIVKECFYVFQVALTCVLELGADQEKVSHIFVSIVAQRACGIHNELIKFCPVALKNVGS